MPQTRIAAALNGTSTSLGYPAPALDPALILRDSLAHPLSIHALDLELLFH